MNKQAIEGVKQFLEGLGIDLTNSDVQETPERVAALWETLLGGMKESKEEVLGHTYPTDCEGLVMVKDIPFYSMCEHHLMPFYGVVDIVYEPFEGRVLGLGRLKRVVEMYSRRLQIQERMTENIGDILLDMKVATGVMVRARGTHLCMLMKGDVSQKTTAHTMICKGSLSAGSERYHEGLLLLGGSENV